jgi:RHS repeat-associated protein
MKINFKTVIFILSGLCFLTADSYSNDCQGPSKPTGLVASANGPCQINLSWNDVSNESKYYLYRGTQQGGPYSTDPIGETSANVTNYSDVSNLQPGTSFYYVVRAHNTCGNSASSDEASATTTGMATNPSPTDDATEVSITPTLKWTPGAGATSHKVYFGGSPSSLYLEDWIDVNSYPYPYTLDEGTTYYWCIDEICACGTTVGTVWSFTTTCPTPGQATAVSPSDGATNVNVMTTYHLSWTAGSGADSQKVYFGTTRPGTYRGTIDGDKTSFKLGTLDTNTTYYWRIDGKNECGTTPGDTWSFTTTASPPAPGQAVNPTPADEAENVYVMTDLSWEPNAYATLHKVYFGTNQTPGTNEYKDEHIETTFDPCILEQGTTYYWRIDEKNTTDTTTGEVWHFTTQVTDPNNYVSLSGSDQYGDGSPCNPYKTIQKGINETPMGYKVIVMQGRYEEDINFDGNSITVTSIDPNDPAVVAATIIDGVTTAVTFNNGEDSCSVLTGFTITDGNRGIYCNAASPTISKCVITDNQTTSSGAGMFNDNASPTVTNCIFSWNIANSYGGGVYNNNSSPAITNCIFNDNDGADGGGIYNNNSSPKIINCSFSKNSGSVIHNEGSSNPVITNCILWNTDSSEISDYGTSASIVTYCDVEDGYPGEGNFDSDPRFVDANDPNGEDNIFGTPDDGLRIGLNSLCIDAADGNAAPDTDVLGVGRVDMGLVPDTGTGVPDYADIGAYEYSKFSGYITSFEQYQGYESGSSIDDNDGWEIEYKQGDGSATVGTALYWYEYQGSWCHIPYQYVLANNCTFLYDTGGFCDKSYIHVNCIPSGGSSINIMNGSSRIASIKFGNDGNIYVLDNGSYKIASTGLDYRNIAQQCRYFVGSPSYYCEYPDYSYENSWMDFVIHFNWGTHTYDVSWTHYAAQAGETIYKTKPSFNPDFRYYTQVKFEVSYDDFMLNRMSIIDTNQPGGAVGPGQDMWITVPAIPEDANILNPLRGQCIIGGKAWYDKLGEYVVKCCPVDLNTADANSWMQVCSGKAVGQNLIRLGCWNTAAYYNGDYFLKIEVYDDLRRLHSEGIITDQRIYNGQQPKTVNVKYPIIGRLKPQTFGYQDSTDLTINWPGTFPFEFKRTYSNSLRSRIFPLFFGWTHNHNIRLIEDSTDDWIVDVNKNPVRDGEGLGIGRLWLCLPSGGGLFIGRVDATDPHRVIYEPMDNENNYIVRRSTLNNPVFDVNYVYYDMSDGRKMTFDVNFTCDHAVPENEGFVGWMVMTGIDSQEDRFGNALHYTWQQFDGNDVALLEITNNRTPAKLVFTNKLLGSGPDVIPLCSKIRIWNGNDSCDAYVNFSLYPNITSYNVSKGPGDIIGSSNWENTWDLFNYSRNEQKQFMLEEIKTNMWNWETGDDSAGIATSIKNNDEGILIRKQENESHQTGYDYYYGTIRQYNYDYDNQGNLITTIDVNVGDEAPLSLSLRKEVFVTSPDGALLSQNISTFEVNLPDGNKFDPCDYHFHNIWHYHASGPDGYIGQIRFHPGGGGATDTKYYYEDSNFPLKPTTIIEYFDDDGDGDYNRPSRKTAIKYDNRGNTIENKVYMDDVNYICTTLDYHQDYDLPVRQTTWQGYCHDDAGGNIVHSGAKVEKRWLYADEDDEICGDGNCGNYLVMEKTLLNDDGSGQWAETSYVYYSDSNGLLKQMTDPENSITYYEYDSNGFPTKVWQGASLVDGEPTGNPQQRFYYNGLGHKVLEADYLGKVEMNVCNALGQVRETRTYIDKDAVQPWRNFVPGYYDDNISSDDDVYDRWESRTLYRWYCAGDKPINVILPTGGSIHNNYVRGENGLLHTSLYSLGDTSSTAIYCPSDDGGYIRYLSTPEGRTLCETQDVGTLFRRVNIDYLYDSMWRVIHKYTHFDKEVSGYLVSHVSEYIKHEEYKYDASGNRTAEKVYKVKMESYDDYVNEMFEQVLEKSNRYEYDILGRLIKQVVDVNSGGVSQTTQFGYDALGNRIYVIDPNGNVIFTDYDNANRKTKDYFAAKPVISGSDIDFVATKAIAKKKKEFHYYQNGKIKDVNSYDYDGSSLLARSAYTYDLRGRIAAVTENITASTTATTSYDYNDVGFTRDVCDPCKYHITITDANNKITWISMYPLGQPQKIVYPSYPYDGYEQYFYYSRPLLFNYMSGGYADPCCYFNGLLEKKVVWDGTTEKYIKYEYDAFGKVEKLTYPDGGYLLYEYWDPNDYNTGEAPDSKIRLLGQFGLPTRITDHRNDNDKPGVAVDSNFMFNYWYATGKIKSYTDYDGYTVNYDYSLAYSQPTHIDVNAPDGGGRIYDVNYVYDKAGRLIDVCEPLLPQGYQNIAGFEYDKNGNRKKLDYYLNGSTSGTTVSINYSYNSCECQCDNHLVAFSTSGVAGLNFSFDATGLDDIDGLGRLKHATETVSYPGQSARTYTNSYYYNMRSNLTGNYANINGSTKDTLYYYNKDGNIYRKFIVFPSDDKSYEYDTTPGNGTVFDSDIMTKAGDDNLTWNLNGQLADKPTISLEYDWESRLRKALLGGTDRRIEAKYTPDGARVTKKKVWDGSTVYSHKYILDVTGRVPAVLLVLDVENNNAILKTYIHADNQVIAQHDGDHAADRYFYLHDRLGSVRMVIDANGTVVNCYTYDPWGLPLESETAETVSNIYLFANYVWDSEISQYHCYRRQYDPVLARFTSRDPIAGSYQEPLTLHKYLYCGNDAINRTDQTGEYWGALMYAAKIINAMNVENVAFADMLNSGMDLLDVAVAMGDVHNQVAAYVGNIGNEKKNKTDYSKGPEAFQKWGVTAEECSNLGKESAEYSCKRRMAVNGGLQSGLYYVGGTALWGVGGAMQAVGGHIVKTHPLLGGALLLGGFVPEYLGCLSAGVAMKIGNNAREAANQYCTCP